jgi:hypothetical protein
MARHLEPSRVAAISEKNTRNTLISEVTRLTSKPEKTEELIQNLLIIGRTTGLDPPTPVLIFACLYFSIFPASTYHYPRSTLSLYLRFFTVHIFPLHPNPSTCTCLSLLCTFLGLPTFLYLHVIVLQTLFSRSDG